MKTSFFSVLFLFIFIISSHAQNTEAIYIKLIDSETSEPISFATIIIKGSSTGVIADYNGEFRIPKYYYDAKESIIISSIGYETTEQFLYNYRINDINIIHIRPQIEALNTVIINTRSKIKGVSIDAKQLVKVSRNMTAKEIVLKAIRKISENLSSEPHSYIGYYRDYQLVDNTFHNLNEGMFETFDKGIHTNYLRNNQNQTAVYSFKQNKDFIQDTTLTKAYNGITKYIKYSQILPRGGNEFAILNIHNPIRNFDSNTFSYVYALERDFPNLHKFRRDKIVYLNDEPLALIAFKNTEPRDFNNAYGIQSTKSSYVDGTIYISLVDFSIHRFNYKVLLPQSKKVLFNVSIEYARQDNHMYLNYITFNNSFVVNEEFELREESVRFENSEQAFYVLFNNTKDKLNFKTILSHNFKFRIGKRRLKSILAEKVSERMVKISVERSDGVPIEIDESNIDDVTYTFKNIEDVKGRIIYGTKTIEGDQFREFFVQKVNLNKSVPSDLNLMIRDMPINNSLLNEFPDANQFWINSPLMNKKYRDVFN